MSFMEYITTNWKIYVVGIIVIVGLVIAIKNWMGKPSEEKIANIKAWLLTAVCAAEKQFGSGTGALKLSYVYGKFVELFPAISSIISFETFSAWVDEVLVTFRSMLENNKNVQEYVGLENKTEEA